MSSRYYIVYPRGDRTKLTVVEIMIELSHELSDYAVASRRDWSTYDDAAKYAKQLASEHGLTFIPDSDEPDYLD